MTNFWPEALTRFAVGGAIVLAVWWVAKYASPRLAGAIAMMPAAFVVAYIFAMQGSAPAALNTFVSGSGLGIVAFIAFILALYFANLHYAFWPALALAYLAWAVVAFGGEFLLR